MRRHSGQWRSSVHKNRHCMLYRRWKGMLDRCYYHKSGSYKRYGGKGIRVCDEWKKYPPFREWAIKAGFRKDLTIDRIGPDKDYIPENCQWIPMAENLAKRRIARGSATRHAKLNESQVKIIKLRLAEGASQTIIAREYNVHNATISSIYRGITWRHVNV